MAPKNDTDHEHHNPGDPSSTPSVNCKLVTHKDESIPSMTIQNEDHTDIMDELAVIIGSDRNTVQEFIINMIGNTDVPTVINGNNKTTARPPSQLRSSIPEAILHWISKMVMKEAVEDKKMELIRSSTKIPENDVDVLDLINTSDLYRLINDGINKYNHHNIVQGVTNDMIGNTNIPKTVHSSKEATYIEQDEINDLNEDLRCLRYELGDNIKDVDNKTVMITQFSPTMD